MKFIFQSKSSKLSAQTVNLEASLPKIYSAYMIQNKIADQTIALFAYFIHDFIQYEERRFFSGADLNAYLELNGIGAKNSYELFLNIGSPLKIWKITELYLLLQMLIKRYAFN
jgi:hypothetical protein